MTPSEFWILYKHSTKKKEKKMNVKELQALMDLPEARPFVRVKNVDND